MVIITVIVITTFGAEGGKGQGLLGRDERSHPEGGEGQEIDGAFEESSVPCELLGTPHRALPVLWPAELSRAWERRQQPGLDSRLESWESRGEPGRGVGEER